MQKRPIEKYLLPCILRNNEDAIAALVDGDPALLAEYDLVVVVHRSIETYHAGLVLKQPET